MKHTIMIVDDHPIVREGLKQVIESYDDLAIVAMASDGEDALQKLDELDSFPELVIVDLLMPRMDGGSLIDQLVGKTEIMILSTEIDPRIARQVIKKGIRGYLLKDEDPYKIADSIEDILRDPNYIAISREVLSSVLADEEHGGDVELSAQQIKLLKLIADGKTNAEIAEQLFVTTRTVKNYLSSVYELLKVHNRAQAIAVAVKKGLI